MSVCSLSVCWASNEHGETNYISIIWKHPNINIPTPSLLALFYLFPSCILLHISATGSSNGTLQAGCHTALCPGCAPGPTADPAPPPGPAAGEDELMGATALTSFHKDFQDQPPSQVNVSIAAVALTWYFLFIYS